MPIRNEIVIKNLDSVIEHFVKDFKPEPGAKIISVENWVDVQKGAVVFHLMVETKEDSGPG